MNVSSPSPLRKKRNFKSLQLPSAPPEDPIATRLAPLPSGPNGDSKSKRRPPPLIEDSDDMAVDTPAPSRMSIHSKLASYTGDFDLKNDELTNLMELGMGNGGSVMKVKHVKSGMIMAKKIILIDAKPSVRKQIIRELQILNDCSSPFIVSSYGAYLAEPNICICMEFMDKTSFDGIYKKLGPIDIDIVGMVAYCVIEGLVYLHNVHKIIHRDIKPSNILCNSKGEIKLCDFGVSGELINSIAHTFVGTSIYMSPERIQGAEYSVKSDVWSLGIAIVELAHGRFPFNDSYDEDSDIEMAAASTMTNRDSLQAPTRHNRRKSKGVSLHGGGATMSIIELMHQIVKEPPPKLSPPERFPVNSEVFVNACLEKDIAGRATPSELIEFAWITESRERMRQGVFKQWTEKF